MLRSTHFGACILFIIKQIVITLKFENNGLIPRPSKNDSSYLTGHTYKLFILDFKHGHDDLIHSSSFGWGRITLYLKYLSRLDSLLVERNSANSCFLLLSDNLRKRPSSDSSPLR